MATRITRDRTEIEWRRGATATADGRPIVEEFGEYRGSEIGVFCDAGGAWSFEVKRRKFVDPEFGGTYGSAATDEAEAKASACDAIDGFEAELEKALQEQAGDRAERFSAGSGDDAGASS